MGNRNNGVAAVQGLLAAVQLAIAGVQLQADDQVTLVRASDACSTHQAYRLGSVTQRMARRALLESKCISAAPTFNVPVSDQILLIGRGT